MIDPTISEATLAEIRKRCEDRMNMSYYKYGSARDNIGGGRVDAVGSADRCITKYQKTNNLEYLHDAINYLVFAIMYPMPGDFFRATDAGESAGTVGTPINMER